MVTDTLRGISPDLDELLTRRDELAAEVTAAERAERFGAESVMAARERLTQAERRRMAGEAVGDERRRAEQALAKAEAESRQPWAQRAEAARRAVRDVEKVVSAMIAERFDEFLAGLHEEAERARERCNAALEEIGAAYRAREATAGRVDALAGVIRRPRFGDVELSRLEPITRDANKLLESGGERSPRLRADPREPRGGAPIPAAESPYAPVRFE